MLNSRDFTLSLESNGLIRILTSLPDPRRSFFALRNKAIKIFESCKSEKFFLAVEEKRLKLITDAREVLRILALLQVNNLISVEDNDKFVDNLLKITNKSVEEINNTPQKIKEYPIDKFIIYPYPRDGLVSLRIFLPETNEQADETERCFYQSIFLYKNKGVLGAASNYSDFQKILYNLKIKNFISRESELEILTCFKDGIEDGIKEKTEDEARKVSEEEKTGGKEEVNKKYEISKSNLSFLKASSFKAKEDEDEEKEDIEGKEDEKEEKKFLISKVKFEKQKSENTILVRANEAIYNFHPADILLRIKFTLSFSPDKLPKDKKEKFNTILSTYSCNLLRNENLIIGCSSKEIQAHFHVLFDLSSLGLISENLCQKAEKLLQGILKDYTQIMSAISYVNPNWRSQYSQFFLGNTQGKKPIWEGGVSKEIVEGKIEQGGQAKGVTSSLELRIWADLPGASSARVDSDEEDDEQPGMPEECKGLN